MLQDKSFHSLEAAAENVLSPLHFGGGTSVLCVCPEPEERSSGAVLNNRCQRWKVNLHAVALLPPCAAVSVWRRSGFLAAAATPGVTAENHKQLLWEKQSPVYQETGAEHPGRPAGRTTRTCSSMTSS